jgi:tetratricopeptide (TPR) repeat protein
VDTVDDEILCWMRKAGCAQISYGIESGSEKIRRRFNKRIKTEQIKKAFDRTRSYGILPRAYFIYGAPGESRETIQETIRLIHDIKPLGAIFYILDIFPGTKLYEDFKKKEKISDDIWLNRVEDIMYFESDPGLSKETIMEFGKVLRNNYYKSLPGFIEDIELISDKTLDQFHADFYSRLGMTFTHGDYAKIDAIPEKEMIAEKLFKKSLSYFQDIRAYLGLGILFQKQKSFQKSLNIIAQGLSHFPESMDLRICQGINQLNLKNFESALSIFLEYQKHAHVIPYIIECYRQMGDFENAKTFSDKIDS